MKHIRIVIATAFTAFITCIRPLLGPDKMCIFHEQSCTSYAYEQLKSNPLYKAAPLIIWRFLRCNPLTLLLRR